MGQLDLARDLLKKWHAAGLRHSAQQVYDGFWERYCFMRASYGGDRGRDDRGGGRRVNAEEDFGDFSAMRRNRDRSRSRSADRDRPPRQSRFS